MTSLYEWKILKWDKKPKTNKQQTYLLHAHLVFGRNFGYILLLLQKMFFSAKYDNVKTIDIMYLLQNFICKIQVFYNKALKMISFLSYLFLIHRNLQSFKYVICISWKCIHLAFHTSDHIEFKLSACIATQKPKIQMPNLLQPLSWYKQFYPGKINEMINCNRVTEIKTNVWIGQAFSFYS